MIETQRLIVRPFRDDDYHDLCEYLSDPVVYAFEPGEPIGLVEAKELAERRARGLDFWAVVLKQHGKLIGHLYLKHVEPKEMMNWELGYIFSPKYQKRGFASEAARALVLFAFKEYRAHRVMARCDPEDPASWKLRERIGFRREGHFRKHGFFRMDEQGSPVWHDAFEYAILESDL